MVRDLIEAGAARLDQTIRSDSPNLAGPALAWMQSLTLTGRLADYFLHPARFPMLRLPGWAVEPEVRHHQDLFADTIYSTICGYYHIRLLDDIVDRQPGAPLDLLPLTALLHTEFHGTYQRHFPAGSAFWPVFRTRWLGLADATVLRPADGMPSPAALLDRAAATIGAVVIPLAALTLGIGVPERFEQWEPVVLEVARAEQLMDDIIDWQQDEERGQPNLLLVEGRDRARPGEPVAAWVVREGYRWGLAAASQRFDRIGADAARLGSAPLMEFLEHRCRLMARLEAETGPGLAQLAQLSALFGPRSA